MIPPLEETFAGNEWRVVEDRASSSPKRRFKIMAKAPMTFGTEVEICAVQYRPHAEAIAALPEMARVIGMAVDEKLFDPAALVENDHHQAELAEFMIHAYRAKDKSEGKS